MTGLSVLAVDDEAPALDELTFLLESHDAVSEVVTASDATQALRLLAERPVDAAFLDISMPGLSGMELAAVLARYASPPALVFVTAHDDRAVQAFDIGAVDYLLKPLRAERLSQAIERVLAVRPAPVEAPESGAEAAPTEEPAPMAGEVIPVERGGVTSLISRDSVSWVEAVGDYARLHTDTGEYLVRVTLSTLETQWAGAGFARVHRSYLVALPRVSGLRSAGSGTRVMVRAHGAAPEVELPVSRRQVRELKDRLVRDPLRSFRSGRS
ncbi:LytTR family DNA-binding domain-containing protein [Gordonia sp. PP30]|uniref:LytR/AlgR family response regulator transcription factor n=1 Tax=Gordonia sp. PP30 TaxID=2935861 RepID=UPI0020000D06|nr:LytTR family DNA-binding domain-containing protein [Gordonia sp. PP30]UQE74783.1 LytTR family DNA-binding domain-containing protein [Gordonia sp. PP30]